MRVAVLGGGGREHAVCQRIKESPLCSALFAVPGNAGTAQLATCLAGDIEDVTATVALMQQHRIDYVVVTPDNPLALGMVDALEAAGIASFGPHAKAAEIESSKVFANRLMKENGIPTSDYLVFDDSAEAKAHILQNKHYPMVIKADGLARGKGAMICETEKEALDAVTDIMDARIFGQSGNRIVVEEFLTGPEVSVLSFCDGETLVPMISSMDHKRIYDGDEGPNTGGMGAVAPNPYYTEAIQRQCEEEIFLPTVEAMRAAGRPFKGCLYFGLMLTPQGPKVIEYNGRLGDPEAQAVLPLMEGDLLEIMLACTNGTLSPKLVRWKDAASACVVLASGGYPAETFETGFEISGLDSAANGTDIYLYQGGTAEKDGKTVTAGGRVASVVAVDKTLQQAVQSVYKHLAAIRFSGAFYRRDIGKQALEVTAGA